LPLKLRVGVRKPIFFSKSFLQRKNGKNGVNAQKRYRKKRFGNFLTKNFVCAKKNLGHKSSHAKNGKHLSATVSLQKLYSASVQVPILSRVMGRKGRKEGLIHFNFIFFSCGLKNVVTLLSLILAPLT
jgi:hypothetical protein